MLLLNSPGRSICLFVKLTSRFSFLNFYAPLMMFCTAKIGVSCTVIANIPFSVSKMSYVYNKYSTGKPKNTSLGHCCFNWLRFDIIISLHIFLKVRSVLYDSRRQSRRIGYVGILSLISSANHHVNFLEQLVNI